MATEQEKLLYAKINMETAQMSWKELERFFALGRLVSVKAGVDMIEVARLMADDDVPAVTKLLEAKHIERVMDDTAKVWAEHNPMLWTVVVKPWILVQEKKDA